MARHYGRDIPSRFEVGSWTWEMDGCEVGEVNMDFGVGEFWGSMHELVKVQCRGAKYALELLEVY